MAYKTIETARKHLSDGKRFHYQLFDNFRDCDEIAKQAVHLYPRNFQYVSDRLKDDADLLNFAIEKTHGRAYKFASDRLRSNPEIALHAFNCGYMDVISASTDSIKFNKDFVFETIEKYPYGLKYASNELRSDVEFIYKILKTYTPDGKSSRNYFTFLSGISKDIQNILIENGHNISCVERLMLNNKLIAELVVDEDQPKRKVVKI